MTDKQRWLFTQQPYGCRMQTFLNKITRFPRAVREMWLWPVTLSKKIMAQKRRQIFATSTAISLWLRPLLERDWVKTAVGAPLVAAMIVGGTQAIPVKTTYTEWKVGEPLQEVLEVQLTTDSTANAIAYNLPTSSLSGVSQFYHGGHQGMDLRAPLGSSVVALMSGTVAEVKSQGLGYGRHIIVDHGDGVQTLYAHLQKSTVTIGQKIDGGAQIGTVGLTGWTTGPHLHFEVYKFGQKVNPLPYLQVSLKAYNEQFQVAQAKTE